MNGPIRSPWDRIPTGPSDPGDLGELAGFFALPKPTAPLTTADLAGRGEVLGTAADVLTVAALVRCNTDRAVLGGVLHLDRRRRGLPAVWLVELLQYDVHDRGVSPDTCDGLTTDGTRLATIDAVPIPSAQAPLDGSVLIDCWNPAHDAHRVGIGELVEAGRFGLTRRSDRDTPRHAVRLSRGTAVH